MQIIPTFAKLKLSIKSKNNKLKHFTARIVMKDEMMYKHQKKPKIKERY